MDRFTKLLDAYGAADGAAARAAVEAALWAAYGVEASVLVLDMSGFSRLTMRHGICTISRSCAACSRSRSRSSCVMAATSARFW